jgi:hypothetical protein
MMSASVGVPLTITDEAAARVAELHMEDELERMLDHTRRTLSGLRRLQVVLDPPYDTGDEPYITIEATRDASLHQPGDPTSTECGIWKVTTFPPEVGRHFSMLIHYEPDDAR